MAHLDIDKIGRLSVSVADPLKRKWPVQVDPNIGVAIREWRRNCTPLNPATAYMAKIAS